MLAISCRVITLALVATQFDWFVGLVLIQIVLWGIACSVTIKENNTWEVAGFYGLYYTLLNIIHLSFDSEKNPILSYWWYVVYWWITMAQNTVLIAMWAAATSEMDLWYRTTVVGYVTMAYIVSLLVKTYHVRKRSLY